MVVVARSSLVREIAHYGAQILALIYAPIFSLSLLGLIKLPRCQKEGSIHFFNQVDVSKMRTESR